ncbi:MAG: 2-oxoacid:acceptor oxidoreductase family protein [archaeon]
MSKEIFEIRFHGRGGQGAKTAAALLAEAALEQGKYVQSFPEYGAERQGAPVKAFVRISDKPITIHSGITHPDVVVVVDPTIMNSVKVADGLDPNGIILVNTNESIDDLKKKLSFEGRIVAIDALKISLETLGKPVTNTTMLGAMAKTIPSIQFETLKSYTHAHFLKKLGKDIADKNIAALERAYKEVAL